MELHTSDERSEDRKAMDRCLDHIAHAIMYLQKASGAAGAANCNEQLLDAIAGAIKHVELVEIEVMTQ